MTRTGLGRPALLVGLALLAAGAVAATRLAGGGDAASFEEELRKAEEMEVQARAVRARIAGKQEVIDACLRGELTLLEAAALFRALNQGPPSVDWAVFRRAQPGRTDEERHCHEVIGWVRASWRTSGGAAERVAAGMEEELRANLRLGELRLPEVPPCGQHPLGGGKSS